MPKIFSPHHCVTPTTHNLHPIDQCSTNGREVTKKILAIRLQSGSPLLLPMSSLGRQHSLPAFGNYCGLLSAAWLLLLRPPRRFFFVYMGNSCTRCCCDGPRVCYSDEGRRLSHRHPQPHSFSVKWRCERSKPTTHADGGDDGAATTTAAYAYSQRIEPSSGSQRHHHHHRSTQSHGPPSTFCAANVRQSHCCT